MGKIELIKVEKVDDKLVEEVVRRIINAVNPIKIILFGSWAYGQPRRESDLDILVVIEDGNASKYEATVKVYRALTGILIPKDIAVITPREIEEWKGVNQAFITSIIKKGRIIYERQT